MKLNSGDAFDPKAEDAIIEDRIFEHYAHCRPALRRVPFATRGSWIDNQTHVKLDSTKGLSPELVKYSHHLKYSYLDPFEALFSLETCQLLIFYKDISLSLAEAHQLLLTDENAAREYHVFRQLNRMGYIALKPDRSFVPEFRSVEQIEPCYRTSPDEPLFKIDEIHVPFQEVLDGLQRLGPKVGTKNDHRAASHDVSFDVYDRENFAKNKPRRDCPGKPKYHVIVGDKSSTIGLPLDVTSLGARVVYAVIDEDYAICFSKFEPVDLSNIDQQ